MNYKQAAISELAEKIKSFGYRVFISKNGEYGFYTNAEGSRVVSFQTDFGSIVFSGNYQAKTHEVACRIGQGWRLEGRWNVSEVTDDTLLNFIISPAPRWAVREHEFTYKTLADETMYGKSSGYVER